LLGRLDPLVFERVPFGDLADAYLVNSCTVTKLAERQSRQFVYQAKRRNPHAIVILSGCYATMEPEELRSNESVDFVVAREDETSALDLILDEARKAGYDPLPVDHGPQFASRTRPFLKVEDGCEAVCSYCIIPRVRGPVRSESVENVLFGLKRFAQQGVKEVVLTGIHVGQWGRDLPGQPGLDVLIGAIADWGGMPRVRLSSLEPLELSDQVIEIIAQSDSFCPHLHIPLQSGSDTILAAMQRPYRTRHYRERIERASQVIPDLGLGIDVIVGFPGETDALFYETLAFLDSLPYHYLHVFPYSERPGTPAAAMDNQIPIPQRRERARCLIAAAKEHGHEMALKQVGRAAPILVERGGESGEKHGFTDNYYDVHLTCGAVVEAEQIVSARITGVRDGAVLAGKVIGPPPKL
jgi:threonylcarbamoyladenosine tRNA methylthiotransferase MtaB